MYFLNTQVYRLQTHYTSTIQTCANLAEGKEEIIIIQSKLNTEWQPFRNWRPTQGGTLPRLNNLGKLILMTETKAARSR